MATDLELSFYMLQVDQSIYADGLASNTSPAYINRFSVIDHTSWQQRSSNFIMNENYREKFERVFKRDSVR